MHFSSMVSILLIVIAVLIAAFVLLQFTGGTSRRHLSKRGGILGKRDHGAHIAKKHGHERSPEWPRVAREHRLREPACVACGHKGSGLQVHHIKPFHLHPQLELDPNNLITLCEIKGRDHHLLLGHLDDWASYNEHIRDDVKHFYKKTAAQIRADSRWQHKVKQRP